MMDALKCFDEVYNKFAEDRRALCAAKRLISDTKTGTDFSDVLEALDQKLYESFNSFAIKISNLIA